MYGILVFALFVASATAVRQCPANEEFKECGTACPVTCDNRHRPKRCMMICVRGCFCKDGYFRNSKGVCVHEDQCDGHVHVPLNPAKKCGENERFTTCGTACPLTCANRNSPPKICTLQCLIGCECQPGFFKNAAGTCVQESQCDDQQRQVREPTKQCGENEELQQCASTCPRTCANRNQGPIPCNRMCKLNSCECKQGFVRSADGRCVGEDECEDTCRGKNEILIGCRAYCQRRCGQKGHFCPIMPIMCTPGCGCQAGFARDGNGDCISDDECAKTA